MLMRTLVWAATVCAVNPSWHLSMLLQALAGLNSWPMTGMRTLIWVQLASVAMMVPRLGPLCQVRRNIQLRTSRRRWHGLPWHVGGCLTRASYRP